MNKNGFTEGLFVKIAARISNLKILCLNLNGLTIVKYIQDGAEVTGYWTQYVPLHFSAFAVVSSNSEPLFISLSPAPPLPKFTL
jgi:hypothetical protein